MRKQSFITGAVILMSANAVSKILEAGFKISLTYILNEEGMAVYDTAFRVYIMFLSFIISGFPTAISKTVAESLSRGSAARARRCTRLLTLILSTAGLAGSILLFIFAPYFAAALKEENAVAAIRYIAPSVFFVTLGTGYKSFFQGASNMVPVAVSQVIESIIKLAVGYALAVYCVKFGMNATVCGAISGVTAGEILATLMLFCAYIAAKRPKNAVEAVPIGKSDNREILKSVFTVALPLMLAAAASNGIGLAETAVVRSRLLDAGLNAERARFLYGAYTGYALTVFHLPTGILAALGISILPPIAGALALGNRRRAGKVAVGAVNLTLCLSLPCAVVMYMLPEELLNALFRNAASAEMLKIAAPSVVPVCLPQIMSAVMQAGGKVTEPFLLSIFAAVIKIALAYALIPRCDIYGLVISSAVSSFLLFALMAGSLKRFLNIKFRVGAAILKPAASAAVMALMIYLLRGAVTARFGGGIITLAAISAPAAIAYALTLLLTGAIPPRRLWKGK